MKVFHELVAKSLHAFVPKPVDGLAWLLIHIQVNFKVLRLLGWQSSGKFVGEDVTKLVEEGLHVQQERFWSLSAGLPDENHVSFATLPLHLPQLPFGDEIEPGLWCLSL